MDLNNEIEEMIQEITPAKASDEREAFGEEPKEEPKEAPKEEPKEDERCQARDKGQALDVQAGSNVAAVEEHVLLHIG